MFCCVVTQALLAVLSAPLPEQRVAVYRFMGAMAVRPWFAAEVVRHVQLLTHVTTAASEATTTVVAGSLDARTHAKSALWRHAAVEALFLTAEVSLFCLVCVRFLGGACMVHAWCHGAYILGACLTSCLCLL